MKATQPTGRLRKKKTQVVAEETAEKENFINSQHEPE